MCDLIAVTALAVFFYFYGVQGRVLRRASEGRVARVAQEFIDTGDWIVPHLNGQARVKKPPLSSWLVAGMAWVRGRDEVTPFDALVPPAASAVLLIVLTYLWLAQPGIWGGEECDGREKEDERERKGSAPGHADACLRCCGKLGALVLAMMPAFIGQGRSAELDMLLALFTFLCFWSWHDFKNKGRSKSVLLFYLGMGFAFLTKGPVAFVLVLPALLVWAWLERKDRAADAARESRRPWVWHALGIVVFLAVVLPWGLPFLFRSGIDWADFSQEFLERVGEETGHREAWYFYLVSLPGWAFPWILLLPLVAWRDWHSTPSKAKSRRRLWWCWFVVNLAIWSLLTAKQRHYAAPWLAPLALLLGEGLVLMLEASLASASAGLVKWVRGVLVFLSALMALGMLGALFSLPFMRPAYVIWTAGLAAFFCFGLGAWRLGWGKRRLPCWTWWAGAACALVVYVGTIESQDDRDRSVVPFCLRVRERVPKSAELYDIGVAYRRPQVLFYLGRNVIPLVEKRGLKDDDETLEKKGLEERLLERQAEAVAEVLRTGSVERYVLVTQQVRDRLSEGSYVEAVAGEARFLGHERSVHLIRAAVVKP